ncbi:MAG: rhomboid family intramembrane serine protease [Chloroflexi bacterium]|nr:rhomboid family intramembrane serine protease [Chloroflexota bacterium]
MIPISDPDLRRRRFPVVSVLLIGANSLVFLYELSLGSGRTAFFYRLGLVPAELTTGREFLQLVAGGRVVDIASPVPTWATLLTSMFIHGDLVHFASNMLYLWVFGDNVEDRAGRLLYLGLYVLAGVVAALTQVLVAADSEVPIVGASGAIAGILGCYFVLFPGSRIRTIIIGYFIAQVRIPAVYLLGFWLLLQFWEGVGSLGPSAQAGGVAYWAHLGGFVAGVLAVLLLRILRVGGFRIPR